MADIVAPSLDHFRIFLTVVEEGSFNAAARRLGRPISVVSYAIAQIEAQLALRLFDREGSRRPRLTEAGKAVLSDALALADDVDALLARVRSLRQGLEAELALAMDVMVPDRLLASVLHDFQVHFPSVALRLHVEGLGAVAGLVESGQATLAIAGPDIAEDRPGLVRELIGSVTLVPVAAPSHPLARSPRAAPGEARRHLQLVLTDRSPLTRGRDFAVLSPRTWRLADLGAKHALLKEGIGWGAMPRHRIEADLAQGTLVQLNLPELQETRYGLQALWRKDCTPGPAATWVLDEFRERLARIPC